MTLPAGFVHDIDPVLLSIGSIPLYWYGFAYSLGFTGVLAWFLVRRQRIGLERGETYELGILVIVGVLVGGRAVEIVIYEWDYYRTHSTLLLSYWHGGMASHGVLVGAASALWVFCRWRRYPYLLLADELVIPAALFLALGRIGNFINGQIVGYPTDVWWGVLFPDLEDYRHPVALYESLKNFALVPVLLLVRRRHPPGCGLLLAHFVFWYGFLRLFSDYFRAYGVEFLGIGRGQYLNLLMALIGLGLMWLMKRRQQSDPGEFLLAAPPAGATVGGPGSSGWPLRIRQLIFVVLVLFCLVIPSSWTKGALEDMRNAGADLREAFPSLCYRSIEEQARTTSGHERGFGSRCGAKQHAETGVRYFRITLASSTPSTPSTPAPIRTRAECAAIVGWPSLRLPRRADAGAPRPKLRRCVRRRPEDTVLCGVAEEHFEVFYRKLGEQGASLPAFVHAKWSGVGRPLCGNSSWYASRRYRLMMYKSHLSSTSRVGAPVAVLRP